MIAVEGNSKPENFQNLLEGSGKMEEIANVILGTLATIMVSALLIVVTVICVDITAHILFGGGIHAVGDCVIGL